jgi:structural maintenance of chromosome 1
MRSSRQGPSISQFTLAVRRTVSIAQRADRIRITFEKNQLASTRERLAALRATVDRANNQLETLAEEKTEIEADLESLQAAIDSQRQKLADETAQLAEITENVDVLRDAARKTQRSLDKALKEIAGWNDEIEKSASDRHAIYRRCRLEEIDLPLVRGNLNKVPIEEDREDELAMDVDDEGTQQVKEVNDYGVEPDFDGLEDEDREVRHVTIRDRVE